VIANRGAYRWQIIVGVFLDNVFSFFATYSLKGSFQTTMNFEPSGDRWYALQVRTRWESSTATLLSGKGYQTLLPTFKSDKRWNGKFKEATEPLFPGYVFCQFDALKRLPVLVTPGVLTVVGRGRTPVPVEDSEIEAIQRVAFSGVHAEPWPYLEVGQQVRIQDGVLSGLEGILTSFKGSRRIVVSVSLLCRSVALEIDRSGVCPIQPARTTVVGGLAIPQLLEPVLA
jgi:transcription antitermination factor NusG